MSCLSLEVHKGGDVVAAILGQLERRSVWTATADVCVDEFIDCSQDVLMPGDIVESVWSVLFYPIMISRDPS